MPWGCPLINLGKLITPSLTGRLPLLGKPIADPWQAHWLPLESLLLHTWGFGYMLF